MIRGGEALPVGRLAFKAREGRQTALSGFNSHSLPPTPRQYPPSNLNSEREENSGRVRYTVCRNNPGGTMSVTGKSDEAVKKPEVAFTLTTSRHFVGWLASTGTSLAVTTYQSGKVILIGTNKETGRLSVFERSSSGRWAWPSTAAAWPSPRSCRSRHSSTRSNGEKVEGGYDCRFVPQTATFTADLDVHDVAFDADGRLGLRQHPVLLPRRAPATPQLQARSGGRPSSSGSPPRTAAISTASRMRDGRPAYVTASAKPTSPTAGASTAGGGVVDRRRERRDRLPRPLDAAFAAPARRQAVAAQFRHRRVRQRRSRHRPLRAGGFLPGYLRGMAFIGDHAVIGLSEPRENRTFAGLPCRTRLPPKRSAPLRRLRHRHQERRHRPLAAHRGRRVGTVRRGHPAQHAPPVDDRVSQPGDSPDGLLRGVTCRPSEPTVTCA